MATTDANKSYLSIPYKMYLDGLVLDARGLPDTNSSSYPAIASQQFQNYKEIETWGNAFARLHSSPERCLLNIPFKDSPPLTPGHSFEAYKVIERWAYQVAIGACGCPCSPPVLPPNPNCLLHIPFKTIADDFLAGTINFLEARAREFDNFKAIERWANRFASGECACTCVPEECRDTEYRELIAAANPSAWWPMDDSGSPMHDESGNGETASLNPTGTTDFQMPGPIGILCSYAIDIHLRGFFNTNISIGATQHYAIMVTFKADVAPSDLAVMATWDGPTGTMLYSQLGDLQLYHNTTAYIPGYTMPLDTWVHALWGWDGATVSLWLDGVNMVSSATVTGPGTSGTLQIGTYDNRGISTWNGSLQHGVVFLDGDADAVLNDTDALAFAEAALSLP